MLFNALKCLAPRRLLAIGPSILFNAAIVCQWLLAKASNNSVTRWIPRPRYAANLCIARALCCRPKAQVTLSMRLKDRSLMIHSCAQRITASGQQTISRRFRELGNQVGHSASSGFWSRHDTKLRASAGTTVATDYWLDAPGC